MCIRRACVYGCICVEVCVYYMREYVVMTYTMCCVHVGVCVLCKHMCVGHVRT